MVQGCVTLPGSLHLPFCLRTSKQDHCKVLEVGLATGRKEHIVSFLLQLEMPFHQESNARISQEREMACLKLPRKPGPLGRITSSRDLEGRS